jgi:hypothetical protein
MFYKLENTVPVFKNEKDSFRDYFKTCGNCLLILNFKFPFKAKNKRTRIRKNTGSASGRS